MLNRIQKVALACALALFAALPLAASGASAAPALKPALEKAAPTGGLLQKVHGCHRAPRIGPLTGLWHRHVGPGCRWVRAGRPGYGPGNACRRWRRICRRRCFNFGAPYPRRCIRRCYIRNAPRFCP